MLNSPTVKHDELPHNYLIEQELLGSMILKKGEIVPKVAAELEPEDFFSSIHQEIYRVILDLHKENYAPSVLLIWERIRKLSDYKGNEKIFDEYVLTLNEVAFTTAYADAQIKIVKENSIRRKMIFFAERTARDATNPQNDVSQLLANFESATKAIYSQSTPEKLMSGYEYIFNRLNEANEKLKPYLDRKTGFLNIDNCQIFAPALYVVGATPAAGKTTFCWQLLNQLSKQGESCIYCSYEMSAHEMYTKMLARETFYRNPKSTLTAADIRRGVESDDYGAVIFDLASQKNSITNMMELHNETVDDLLRLLRPHCEGKEKAPVVCIDYLQIIPPADEKKLTTDKAKIDDIVRKLKDFQRETNTTFIVISSFNRGNYTQQAGFESFKESGNIEYSADVVWALQLDIVNHFRIGTGVSEIRNKIEEATRTQPRKIQLKCLKNRLGNKYDAYFDYYSAFDCFKVGVPSKFDDADDDDTDKNIDASSGEYDVD